jgi:hypothetical protein
VELPGEAWIRLSRVVNPGTGDLFAPLPGSGRSGRVDIGGRVEEPEHIGRAFLKAADTLAEAWRRSDWRDDDLALPVLQAYRHAIELLLKWACIEVRRNLNFGQHMGIGEDTVPNDFAARLNTHSISSLIELYDEMTPGLNTGDSDSARMPQEIMATFRQLHEWDSNGQAFRYGSQAVREGKKIIDWRQVRPVPVEVDLDAAITRLHDAAQMIEGGFGGWIDAYHDYLQDMWQEYESNLQHGY